MPCLRSSSCSQGSSNKTTSAIYNSTDRGGGGAAVAPVGPACGQARRSGHKTSGAPFMGAARVEAGASRASKGRYAASQGRRGRQGRKGEQACGGAPEAGTPLGLWHPNRGSKSDLPPHCKRRVPKNHARSCSTSHLDKPGEFRRHGCWSTFCKMPRSPFLLLLSSQWADAAGAEPAPTCSLLAPPLRTVSLTCRSLLHLNHCQDA